MAVAGAAACSAAAAKVDPALEWQVGGDGLVSC
jgi:hypothetical protein